MINFRVCDVCGIEYLAKRPSSRYCSDRCRQRAKRAGMAGTPGAARLPSSTDTPLIRAVTAELESAGEVDSWLGRAALMLALRLGDPACPSSAVARLSKELQATMAAALKDVVIVDRLMSCGQGVIRNSVAGRIDQPSISLRITRSPRFGWPRGFRWIGHRLTDGGH